MNASPIAGTHTLLSGLLLLAGLIAQPATALEFQCTAPGDTRYLRLELPGREHLCEVTMTMGLSGERRIMWYADNDTLFCSAKAYDLRDKFVDIWKFDCSDWPDRDGVDKLTVRHRKILDQQLTRFQARANENPSATHVVGVRAAASTAKESAPGILALQLFLDDGSDLVRVIADDGDEWHVMTEISSLADIVGSIDRYRLIGAYVDSVSDSAALGVVTLLSPDELTADASGASTVCEGRQTFQPDGSVELAAITPHRHICR